MYFGWLIKHPFCVVCGIEWNINLHITYFILTRCSRFPLCKCIADGCNTYLLLYYINLSEQEEKMRIVRKALWSTSDFFYYGVLPHKLISASFWTVSGSHHHHHINFMFIIISFSVLVKMIILCCSYSDDDNDDHFASWKNGSTLNHDDDVDQCLDWNTVSILNLAYILHLLVLL